MLLIGDDKVPEIWINILINIGTSIFFSVGTSLFVYYKFLKRLPEESKNQIEELLNKRLNYETTNHNATLQNSNLDSINKLSTFGETFEKINLENIRLKDENLKLTSENQRLREWIDNVKLSVPPISPHL